jgi:hypothetical protein
MVAVPYSYRNFTAGGAIVTPPPAKILIHGVMADVVGTVKIVDGTGKTVLNMVLGAPGYISFGNGAIVCNGGGTLTLTGVTNCGLVMTP